MKDTLVTPHEQFETIEEVFAYADQAMDTFKNSGVANNTPRESLVALFTMNKVDNLSQEQIAEIKQATNCTSCLDEAELPALS